MRLHLAQFWHAAARTLSALPPHRGAPRQYAAAAAHILHRFWPLREILSIHADALKRLSYRPNFDAFVYAAANMLAAAPQRVLKAALAALAALLFLPRCAGHFVPSMVHLNLECNIGGVA